MNKHWTNWKKIKKLNKNSNIIKIKKRNLKRKNKVFYRLEMVTL